MNVEVDRYKYLIAIFIKIKKIPVENAKKLSK